MPKTTRSAGRVGQRRRTRKAIVEAAMGLLIRDRTPSIAEIAAAADVSRRTVYMYFPTLDQLLLDAALGLATDAPIGRVATAPDSPDDVEGRVDAMARAVQRMSSKTENMGRAIIRLTVDARPATGAPRRGYRRVEWIEGALEPVRDRLAGQSFERLVSALSLVIGWEALLVQRDVRGLTSREAEEVSAWAARSLVRAALAESTSAGRKRAKRPATTR